MFGMGMAGRKVDFIGRRVFPAPLCNVVAVLLHNP